MTRQSEKIFMGDGGNEKLTARMRAQANFIENVPLLLILIALIELAVSNPDISPAGPIWLWVAGTLVMIGRIAHALGMDGSFKQGRPIGTLTAMIAMLVLGIYALVLPHLPQPPAPNETVQTQE